MSSTGCKRECLYVYLYFVLTWWLVKITHQSLPLGDKTMWMELPRASPSTRSVRVIVQNTQRWRVGIKFAIFCASSLLIPVNICFVMLTAGGLWSHNRVPCDYLFTCMLSTHHWRLNGCESIILGPRALYNTLMLHKSYVPPPSDDLVFAQGIWSRSCLKVWA